MQIIGALVLLVAMGLVFRGGIEAGSFGELLRSLPGWGQTLVAVFVLFVWMVVTPDRGWGGDDR